MKTIKTGAIVGIDLGIKEFAITSDGQHIENQNILESWKLARLQKNYQEKQLVVQMK